MSIYIAVNNGGLNEQIHYFHNHSEKSDTDVINKIRNHIKPIANESIYQHKIDNTDIMIPFEFILKQKENGYPWRVFDNNGIYICGKFPRDENIQFAEKTYGHDEFIVKLINKLKSDYDLPSSYT